MMVFALGAALIAHAAGSMMFRLPPILPYPPLWYPLTLSVGGCLAIWCSYWLWRRGSTRAEASGLDRASQIAARHYGRARKRLFWHRVTAPMRRLLGISSALDPSPEIIERIRRAEAERITSGEIEIHVFQPPDLAVRSHPDDRILIEAHKVLCQTDPLSDRFENLVLILAELFKAQKRPPKSEERTQPPPR